MKRADVELRTHPKQPIRVPAEVADWIIRRACDIGPHATLSAAIAEALIELHRIETIDTEQEVLDALSELEPRTFRRRG